jgi:hypothetical protein
MKCAQLVAHASWIFLYLTFPEDDYVEAAVANERIASRIFYLGRLHLPSQDLVADQTTVPVASVEFDSNIRLEEEIDMNAADRPFLPEGDLIFSQPAGNDLFYA